MCSTCCKQPSGGISQYQVTVRKWRFQQTTFNQITNLWILQQICQRVKEKFLQTFSVKTALKRQKLEERLGHCIMHQKPPFQAPVSRNLKNPVIHTCMSWTQIKENPLRSEFSMEMNIHELKQNCRPPKLNAPHNQSGLQRGIGRQHAQIHQRVGLHQPTHLIGQRSPHLTCQANESEVFWRMHRQCGAKTNLLPTIPMSSQRFSCPNVPKILLSRCPMETYMKVGLVYILCSK